MLLREDATLLEALCHKKRTALLYAANHGHLSVVKVLIRKGASLVAVTAEGYTALDMANIFHRDDIANFILDSFAKQWGDREGRLAAGLLLQKSTYSFTETATPRLQVQTDCGKLSNTQFRRVLRILGPTLQNSINGSLPLHTAIAHGAVVQVIETLVDIFPEALQTPNNNGDLPLHVAFHANAERKTMLCLITAMAEHRIPHTSNIAGDFPLHLGCRANSRLEIIRLLMQHYPAAGNVFDYSGQLPVHLHLSSTSAAEVVEFWKSTLPRALLKSTRGGNLPFHTVALKNSASVDVVFEVLKGHPDALLVRRLGR